MSDPSAAADHPDVNADGTLWTGPVPSSDLPPGVQRVAVALARLGATGQIRELPERAATAATAAAALGVEVAAICNSLIFEADRSPLLVLASGAHRVDLTKVEGIVGASTVRRATPEFVRSATGQPIGGVAPVGHPNPLRTLVDVDLSRFPVVWAAGGHPHFVFPTSYHELLRITAGEAVEVGEG
ncbi:MAG TPA: YbaK/EbsC family protein [Candidatus Nanopelagicales bacterium]|jgi:prolyl-tRNA editing enzyme YbaK/EbsC (Cys-tRNA(Pro) deacylase)